MNYNVDYGNVERIVFFRDILEIMTNLNSTYDTVNNLIRRLYNISCNRIDEQIEDKIDDAYIFDDFEDKKIVRRQVDVNDLYLYVCASLLKEYKMYTEEDMLSDGISSIYFLLDNVIHPDPHKEFDYNDVRYFVEVEYA